MSKVVVRCGTWLTSGLEAIQFAAIDAAAGANVGPVRVYDRLPEELRSELPLKRIWALVPSAELSRSSSSLKRLVDRESRSYSALLCHYSVVTLSQPLRNPDLLLEPFPARAAGRRS